MDHFTMETINEVKATSNDNMRKMLLLRQQMFTLQNALSELRTISDSTSDSGKGTIVTKKSNSYGQIQSEGQVCLRYLPKVLKKDLAGRILCHVFRTLTEELHRFLFPGRHSPGLYYPFDLICEKLEAAGAFGVPSHCSHVNDNKVNLARERWGLLQKKYDLDNETIDDFKLVINSITEEYNPIPTPNLSRDQVRRVISMFSPENDGVFSTACHDLLIMWDDIVLNEALQHI